MKTIRNWQRPLLTGLLTLLTTGVSYAQQMNYQGRLTDAAGNPVPDAQYGIVFNIYDAAAAGALKWGPQTNPVDVVQGRFNTILGPTDARGTNIVSAFDGGTKYLEITFQGNPILPRQQILNAPTAFFAEQAGRLASVFVLNGNVGVGTTNPTARLDVAGNAAFSGNVGIGGTNSSLSVNHLAYSDVTMTLQGRTNNPYLVYFMNSAGTPKFNITDTGNVTASGIVLATNVTATSNVTALGNVTAARDVTATRDVTALGNVTASGNVTANGKGVVVGEENNLRIVRGTVNADGTKRVGAGFVSSRTAQGRYTITLINNFSSEPSVIITPNWGELAYTGYTIGAAPNFDIFVVFQVWGEAGRGADNNFSFIAIGPR